MKKIICLLISSGLVATVQAQFPPQAGLPGSDAIHANDDRIVDWASGCSFERGWKDIADTTLGRVTIGSETDPLGPPEIGLLCLGDGGSATLTFDYAIRNGEGPDFAVFENGFTNLTDSSMAFLELAFVEVSSDGSNFYRFPSKSNIPVAPQLTNEDFADARFLHNLAGKYIKGYGTPFDLEELKDEAGLDVNNISHVRVIDVVGSIRPEFASYDSEGQVINDPYPTPYATGGFDLQAVGVLHSNKPSGTGDLSKEQPMVLLYPNPARDEVYIQTTLQQDSRFHVVDVLGRRVSEGVLKAPLSRLDISRWPAGSYWLQVQYKEGQVSRKIVKEL